MPFINDRLNQSRETQQPGTAGDAGGQPTAEDFARTAVGRVNARLIDERLRETIFGQEDAVSAIFRTMSVVQAGLADRERPLASHLFVGPTGTGKTEIVRQLAAVLRRGPDDFCRVDMSSMAQEHYAASFSGAPPGYAGSKEGLSIFDRTQIEGDMSMPGIVLFDEVEKAHQTVLRALLHVLDRGTLVLANGQQKFSFRNCIVFMTSNLGSREIRDAQTGRLRRGTRQLLGRLPGTLAARAGDLLAPRINEVTTQALEAFFDPEFLNRIDEVTVFSRLDTDTALQIVEAELRLFARRVAPRGVTLSHDERVVRQLFETGFDPVYGARSIRREIRHSVWPQVARAVISHKAQRQQDEDAADISLRLTTDGSRIVLVGD